jgi:hypothetical protein
MVAREIMNLSSDQGEMLMTHSADNLRNLRKRGLLCDLLLHRVQSGFIYNWLS